MNRDRLFELRVLTGTHAGARALLPSQPQTLGSDRECDLILTDEGVLPRHACLELQDDGSTVLRWLQGELPPLVVRPGEATHIGSVKVALAHSDAAWEDDVPLVESGQHDASEGRASDSPHGAAQDADADADTNMVATRDGEPAAGEAEASSAPSDRARRRPAFQLASNRLIALLSLLALVGVMAVAWTAKMHSAATPEAGTDSSAAETGTAPAGATPPVPVDAVTRAVNALGLAPRVQVHVRAGQPTWVQASLLTDDETERLASTLARLSPRPRLRLLSESDVMAEVTAVLDRYRTAGSQPLAARATGEGRFVVTGRVADAAARDSLMADLRKSFPQVPAFESAMTTQAEAAADLVADLQGAGWPGVTSQWSDEVLALSITLRPSDVRRWEQALLAAASRHDVKFRATVAFAEIAPSPRPSLPFVVRSVISSDMPHVTLADGRKLFPGASVQGWRLTQVQAGNVTFEDATGRRFTLER